MSTNDRYHSLDAARGFALLLGIVLHATMSFFMVIPAQDRSQSVALGVAFYAIHTFRMTLFFLLAGFFAHLAFHRRGSRAFAGDRAKRIVVPMTVGWVVLAPATIAAVIWGLKRTFPALAAKGAGNAAAASEGFPLIHLWFLYYLCIFYVLTLVLRPVFVMLDRKSALRSGLDRMLETGLASRLLPIALAAPTFAVLYLDRAWPVWFGIKTPDTGLVPKVPAIVAFGTAFLLGWLMQRRPLVLGILERQWSLNLAAAVVLTTTCLGIVGTKPDLAAPTVLAGGAVMRAAYAACYALSIWAWAFGLLGAAVRFFPTESAVRRYVADASYWMYLVHLPVVFVLQVALMNVPLHWAIKFPAIVAITVTVSLVSYHYLVRYTLIGEMLNGRRTAKTLDPVVGLKPVASAGLRRAVIPKSRSTDGAQRGEESPAIPGRGVDGDPAPSRPALSDSERSEEESIGRLGMTGRAAGAKDVQTPSDGLKPLAPLAAQLVNVTKRYGKTVALDGLSLAVRAGELLAVLGPNGAGKSTAIGLWLGTLEPDEGSATIMGGSPLDVESRLGLGVMMQEVALAPTLTTREHIELTSSYYRHPRTVEETLALTATESLAARRHGRLSAGQKRQVQFATAVCGRPRLLFLDEPTVGLDIQAREAMWRTIRHLRDEGCSIVLTTHYLEEAEALADRVAVLAKGRLIAEGSVHEMRALVSRKRISCASSLAVEEIRSWPGVVEAVRDAKVVHVTASDAEDVVRRMLAADAALSHLEVKQASLAEAFTELTKEAA